MNNNNRKEVLGCEYCRGAQRTDAPFTVITHSGDEKKCVFNFCPYCGRELKEEFDEGLYIPVELPPNCINCCWLDLTGTEQHQKENDSKKYRCTCYETIVRQDIVLSEVTQTDYIYPCIKCFYEKFIHYKKVGDSNIGTHKIIT